MKRIGLIAVLSAAMWCTGLVSGGASAATLTYSVDMTWTNPNPACVDPVVCSGVGTSAFAYGVPVEPSTQVSLTITTLPSVTQTNSSLAKAGELTYCNGSVLSNTNVSSIDLNAAFATSDGATGSVAPTTLLVNTENIDGDPVASADQLSLSSAPDVQLHVLEDQCATIDLLTRFTPGTTPTLTVELGDVVTPDTGYTTIDGLRQVDIDIRPYQRPRPIDLSSREIIPVAIYGSALNDVTQIDRPTVRFEGAKPIFQIALDVDRDGIKDLLILVPTRSITTLQAGDTAACATFDNLVGDHLGGCQAIQVIRSSGHGHSCYGHGGRDDHDRAYHDRWNARWYIPVFTHSHSHLHH